MMISKTMIITITMSIMIMRNDKYFVGVDVDGLNDDDDYDDDYDDDF